MNIEKLKIAIKETNIEWRKHALQKIAGKRYK